MPTQPSKEVPYDPNWLDELRMAEPREFGRIYDAVVDAIETLEGTHRTVIDALFWERLSEEKLAERLGCSRSSIRWHKKQALEKLREVLADAVGH